MSKSYDFVAIGDITTDAFIRLKDASVHCDINQENCTLSVSFGDKVPYEFVEVVRAVGNSPNAAVTASRLGLSSALVANLGNDQNGEECLDSLKNDGVSLDFMTTHEDKDTNYHYVLWYEDERTILVKHQQFEYKLPNIGKPKWIYLSSMGESSLDYHDEISGYLEKNPEVKLAFQPGTFQMKMGTERLSRIYNRTEIFFCNVDEAKRILGIENHTSIKDLLMAINKLGPKIVVITDGPKGAHAFDGENYWSVPVYPDPKAPYERTGAGDAFSSTVTTALVLGEPLENALLWGPINSMSVVQQIGAQKGLLSRKQTEEYLKNAPETYKPMLIE
jgi:ribokinase